MAKPFVLPTTQLTLSQSSRFVFEREAFSWVEIKSETLERVRSSHVKLTTLLEKRLPIYGVTTGFGDSCFRFIEPEHAEKLQANLISYLLCGTGAYLPIEATRAMFLFRLNSLSRGYSGVSFDLIDRMSLFLSKDWIPVVPREGSLGASGDLIPLAYLAQCLQGQGQVHVNGKIHPTSDVLREAGTAPYKFKPKEGLALVNGTSAMTGMFLTNLIHAKYILQTAMLSTGWAVLALKGRTEPFGTLVNDRAGQHLGQSKAAKKIRELLADEKYSSKPLEEIKINESHTAESVQDRYSLRCAPQILGPVLETIIHLQEWLEAEINSTSDNPLIDDDGSLGMGGNFYGGYLSQGMDYLKISLAHVSDMLDRQLATLIDEKSNRGLAPNLANWNGLPEDQRFLHHGLKGLHQSMSALTSEIMSKATPNGIFSRSSESHNQDKVSLGMSAAVQCAQMIEQVFTAQSIYLICLCQALDLRNIKLEGKLSKEMYRTVRATVPFISHDQPLDMTVRKLAEILRDQAGSMTWIDL